MAHTGLRANTSFGQVVFFSAALAITCFATAAAIGSPTLSLGIVLASAFAFLSYWRTQVAIAVWLAATVFVPFWTVLADPGILIQPYYFAVPVVIGAILRRLHDRVSRSDALRVSIVDLSLVLGVALVLCYQSIYDQASFLSTNVLVTLFGGYVVGRLSGVIQYRVFAILMIIVAVWGIAEFAFNWHVFVNWQADAGGIGPALQQRGGFTRSEASLGHAIAYGACLAAAIPFVRGFKRSAILQLILVAGVIVSFSRGPILAVVFTFALIVFVERSPKRRLASAIFLILGLAITYVIFTFLYNGVGQGEVDASTTYRDNAVAGSIQFVNLFGPADGLFLNSAGRYETNGVDIIDSAPLRLALDFGWVACALLLMPAVFAAISVLRRKAGPATVALAAQIPVLLVTSFITQWQTLFYFLAGLAVTEMVRKRTRKQDDAHALAEPQTDLASTP